MPLDDLVPYIDWTFFFAAWELKGRFPAILDHPEYGAAARELYDSAQALLDRIVAREAADGARRLRLLAGHSDGDDIVVYADDSRTRRAGALQHAAAAGDRSPTASRTCRSPTSSRRAASGAPDYLGAFAVTAGIGADELARAFEREHDDYSAIMVKALADRLAEAFAEYLHAQRAQGLGLSTSRAADDRRAHRTRSYRGIRPAFGYPACPDHSEKFKLFDAARRRRRRASR